MLQRVEDQSKNGASEEINTQVELTHGGSPEDSGGARPRLGGASER